MTGETLSYFHGAPQGDRDGATSGLAAPGAAKSAEYRDEEDQVGDTTKKRTKVLALSSGGGHWIQLLRLRPAFANCEVVFATVKEGYRADLGPDAQFRLVPDANRWNKLGLVRALFVIFRLVWRERPDVVISTGAAPGYFAIRIGNLLGARTIWVDSIANGEELSLSGKKAKSHAALWLTQWADLAQPDGPHFRGNVL